MSRSDPNKFAAKLSVFFSFVKKYPAGSMISGGGDEHLKPKQTLINVDTQKKIAYFDWLYSPGTAEDLFKLSSKYHSLLERQKLSVPVYLLTPSQTGEIAPYILDADGWREVRLETIPTYKELATSPSEKDVSSEVASLKSVSGLYALILGTLVGLDIFNLVAISSSAMWLLIAIGFLLVLPFYESIEALGITLKQKNVSAR